MSFQNDLELPRQKIWLLVTELFWEFNIMSPFEPILQKHVWLQKIYDSACQRVLMNDEDKVAKLQKRW